MDIVTEDLPEDADGPPQQQAVFARALRRLGRRVETLAIRDGDVLVGRAVAIRRGRARLISRGPVWAAQTDGPSRRAGLDALRRRSGPAGALIVNAEAADVALRRAGFLPLLTPAWVADWDLGVDCAARRAGLDPDRRARLRQAERAGWTVRCGPMPPDAGHWLLSRDAARARVRGYRPWPPSLVAALAAEAPERARLFTAARDGREEAGLLVLLHGGDATCQTAWSSEAGHAGQAQTLLMWRAAEWLADRGIGRFELGTIDTVAAPGLARFKLGFGARARPLGGTWGALRLF